MFGLNWVKISKDKSGQTKKQQQQRNPQKHLMERRKSIFTLEIKRSTTKHSKSTSSFFIVLLFIAFLKVWFLIVSGKCPIFPLDLCIFFHLLHFLFQHKPSFKKSLGRETKYVSSCRFPFPYISRF